MEKKMLIDSSSSSETRMAIIEDENLIEYESEISNLKPTKGNIYLAKIIRVEPSLQAAFVDYGSEKHGFLAYNEIHPDYFKIPTADRERILAQEAESFSQNDEDEEENFDEIGQKDTKSTFLNKVIDFFNFQPIDENFRVKTNKKITPIRIFKKNKSKNYFSFHRQYSIQEVIKKNQVILIQIVKEERGNKGAAVTTRLSLAGRYCVLMPNTNKGGGISRKVNDIGLRKDLKNTLASLKIKNGMGVIIRTAGQFMKKNEIAKDYKALLSLWSEITSKTIKSNAPCLIHEEGDLLKRSIRDYFSNDFKEIIINSKIIGTEAKKIMKFFIPKFVKLIKIDNEKKGSIFSTKKIEQQILNMYKPTVILSSGGYLVINQTEALVSIDVNSGKSTKQRNIEDTAYKTNLEAAEEISRQVKLRDLAGLIVIDFIDMLDRSNIYKVERKMRESIKSDRARVQCGKISNFGLLEMSRQRLKQNMNTNISSQCIHCNGHITSPTFASSQIIRVCKEVIFEQKLNEILLYVSNSVASELKNCKKNPLENTAKKNKIKFNYRGFSNLNNLDCAILSKNEVVFNNLENEKKLNEIFNDIQLNHNKHNKLQKNSKAKQSKEIESLSSSVDQKKVIQNNLDNIGYEESKISKKSFRAKAEDFSKKNKSDLKTKKGYKVKNLKTLSTENKDDINKRQGWWSQ